jgi:hypothetical protein
MDKDDLLTKEVPSESDTPTTERLRCAVVLKMGLSCKMRGQLGAFSWELVVRSLQRHMLQDQKVAESMSEGIETTECPHCG